MVDYVTIVDTTRASEICADGGIGRHERLKISWPHGRAGSSPALRTRNYETSVFDRGFVILRVLEIKE